jgi:flagellin-like hook-associated protein FlgL
MSTINLTARISLNATQLRDRITVLGEQVSTGRKGKTYAAIGTDAPKAMDLRAEIGRRETYQTTINQTLSKIRVSQDVLDRIGAIAQKFTANTAKLLGAAKPEEIQVQAAQAEAAMVEVASLLNEQLNGEYLFGGSDSHNPPISNPQAIATSGMGLAIKTRVASLNGSNVASVLTDTKAFSQSNAAGTTPFSVFLSTGSGATEARTNILGNENDRVAYGIHANRNAAIVSTGETTGSWARDLLRGLASIAGLTPDKAQLGNDYTTFVTTVRKGLESAVDALALERGSLGLTETRLQSMASFHESVSTSLTLQLSNLEEVDMAKTITSFQTTQSQLEASYRALAISQQLSLTRFL